MERAQPTSPHARRVYELADRLRDFVRRFDAAHDARAVFAYVYYNITKDLAAKLEDPASGFHSEEWVAELALAFGERYTDAMDALDAWQRTTTLSERYDARLDEVVPRPWADVYRAICRERSYVLEDLLFCMAAHISYDLPMALLRVDMNARHMSDYHEMNEVLASRTEFIQKQVAQRYAPFLTTLDWLAGSFDEFFSNYGIRMSRSVAWYNAMRMTAENEREHAHGSTERSTYYFIESVRRPKQWWQRLLVRTVRWILPSRRTWPD